MQPTIAGTPGTAHDEDYMARAIAAAQSARLHAPPNPWVGAVLVTGASAYEAATAAPGGPHAEVSALRLAVEAGETTLGAVLYTTLEPCAHVGRTPPCVDAIVAAGVGRVVVALVDPDPRVAGRGIDALRSHGVHVSVGVHAEAAERQLAPYLKHRRTGRPWVVLKLAASMDGRTAAPDGSSRWITGEAARRDAHELRAASDAVLVGAGTVRADDPELTVRLAGPAHAGFGTAGSSRQPLRVVLGHAPEGAKVLPALELSGDLGGVLEHLGGLGVVQLLVEGGPRVAHDLHAAGFIDRYVVYVAPALFGGDDGRPLFDGAGAPTISDVWRGRILSVEQLGEDLRVELAPAGEARPGQLGGSGGPDRPGGAEGAELLSEIAESPESPEGRQGREGRERGVRRVSEARIPTVAGDWRAVAYEAVTGGDQHLALVKGDVVPDLLVRVHSECLTGDVFGSLRCDCGSQLRAAMARIDEEGRGVVVYLRGHEGRGIGLAHKIRAYRLQEQGHDTVDANVALGLPVDTREYGTASQILVDLGATTVRLMTNNPAKHDGIDGWGLAVVGRVPLQPAPNPENLAYLRTKRERMGHLIEGLEVVDGGQVVERVEG
ncbi:MAG TPA: bifunctional diaminohydroxyphosphoribosylaminopyrimidine deaminase/5-amino-6-(5-phosphoribosylamino)uracil reductase RibD, partial [Acidimicrobiales bacterium]|nr:bifunctional diaminohydroxyphosphoribosylaminopyrimidine deaminase/5-amino-6-(5-phosphoribosylamino)uracil reductase RibD [Acidimicrobiales bacterium]